MAVRFLGDKIYTDEQCAMWLRVISGVFRSSEGSLTRLVLEPESGARIVCEHPMDILTAVR